MNAVLLAGFRRFSVIPAAPWVDGNNVTNFTSLWRALRGVEGAVTWGQLVVFRLKSRRVMVASLIGPRMNGLSIWHEAATNTSFNIADSVRNILHNRGVQCRSAGDFLSIQLFRTNYEFLANVSVTLIHVCSTFDFRKSIVEAGLVERHSGGPRKTNHEKIKHSKCVNRECCLTEPSGECTRTNIVYWTNIRRYVFDE